MNGELSVKVLHPREERRQRGRRRCTEAVCTALVQSKSGGVLSECYGYPLDGVTNLFPTDS